MKKILLVGAGQIGSRHLEGLFKIDIRLSITIIEPIPALLNNLRLKWLNSQDKKINNKKIIMKNKLVLEKNYDVAIIATSSKNRSHIIRKISKKSNINFWIIEKVLAQSYCQMKVIEKATSNALGVYINTPRRLMPWYQKIKKYFFNKGILQLNMTGSNWGLACNTIHFIDLICWMTGEKLISVSTDNLNKEWTESKRKGYYEISGKLELFFSRGSKSVLVENNFRKNINPKIKISNKKITWCINEELGIARSNKNKILKGKIIYQSDMTGSVIKDIIRKKDSKLPSLKESLEQHRIYVDAMLLHWNLSNNKKNKVVPIT
jgi:hypothetical protein